MFRIFKKVRLEFDFHSRDVETGEAILCSEVIPSPNFSKVVKTNFEKLISEPEKILSELSQERDQELTIYLKPLDFLYFLSLYLKSTLEVDTEFVLKTYFEVLERLKEIDNTFMKPSAKFKDGINYASSLQREDLIKVIEKSNELDYLESYENLPVEILLAHFFKTGEVKGKLADEVLEFCHVHLITTHDAMLMAGLISDDYKPYADIENYKRQEMCEPQDCRCSSSQKKYEAKLGKEIIEVVDYARKINNG